LGKPLSLNSPISSKSADILKSPIYLNGLDTNAIIYIPNDVFLNSTR